MDRSVPRPLIAAVALCACAAAAAGDPIWPLAAQELIHNAHFWEARGRGDLAQLALKKLVAARPDSPEALLELGELDLRLNEFADAARVESELARRSSGCSRRVRPAPRSASTITCCWRACPTDSRRRTRASAVWPTVIRMIHATSWHWRSSCCGSATPRSPG